LPGWRSAALALVLLGVVLSGCHGGAAPSAAPGDAQPVPTRGSAETTQAARSPGKHVDRPVRPFRHLLPGMPRVIHDNVYAATGAGMLLPRVARDPAYLYVPDSNGSTTTVIDQRTRRVVRVIHSGALSQHVNPSYDLRTLYVDASAADQLVAINPRTARVERRIPVTRPYNLYFTPDGRQAIVMAEEHDAITFTDPQTFKRGATLRVRSCDGPNHADFSGNGRFFVVTCEFSGTALKISTLTHAVIGRLSLGAMSMPQDIRISPDGTTFFIAEMGRDEVAMVDARTLKRIGKIKTPSMPHGLMPSRDGRFLYVTDRGAGEVSVVSFARRSIVDTWVIPGGGSPDMGAVSANGRMLWVSGRFDGDVYGFNTRTGRLAARIHVGGSPHGLAVWPQPGRYSLGHTGNTR
jgi:DNA-binding beta-propeller fold protein YncE